MFKPCQISAHHGAQGRVDDSGRDPLVLTNLRHDFVRCAYEDVGKAFADSTRNRLFMGWIVVAVKEADGDRFDGVLLEIVENGIEIRKFGRDVLGPDQVGALDDFMAKVPCYERWRFWQTKIVVVRFALTANF